VAQFDALWTRFNDVYPSFAYKGGDWRMQRAIYRPRAQRARSQDELVAVLVEMLTPLRDLHVWLVDPRGQAVPTFRPASHANFEYARWESAMRDASCLAHHRDFGEGTIGGYAYLYLGSWKEPVNQEALDLALARMRNAPGLMIDVRTNAGGTDQTALARVRPRQAADRRTRGRPHPRGGMGSAQLRQRARSADRRRCGIARRTERCFLRHQSSSLFHFIE
jgi:hypothetical protein